MPARTLGIAAAVLFACQVPASAQTYPLTVRSCAEAVTFNGPPQRPVVTDMNMVQTVVDLGLLDRFVAVTGIQGAEHYIQATPAQMDVIRKKEPQVGTDGAERYPSLQGLLSLEPDFYFAGWRFGLNRQTLITPERLALFGVKTYVLNESCIREGPRAPISMDTLYTDILSLGQIFGVTARAEAMVADFRKRVTAVTARTSTAKDRFRVMYCGDCNAEGVVLTVGAEGMPRLLATLAGGKNILDDVPDSYVRVPWARVIDKDPEWIIISDNRIPTDDIIKFLTTKPGVRDWTAVKKRQFVFMTYPERSPSTRNVDALERLARTLHPELF